MASIISQLVNFASSYKVFCFGNTNGRIQGVTLVDPEGNSLEAEEWLTIRKNYTAAETDTAIISVSDGQKIKIKRCSAYVDSACTASVAVRVGFGASNTPTESGVILSHPGISAGSGAYEFYGDAGMRCELGGQDLRITCEEPTNGSIDVVTIYKLVAA